MPGYNFNVQIKTDNFEVKVDTRAKYGYFEHDTLGEERGGGLWFGTRPDLPPVNWPGVDMRGYTLELTDYDGTAVLPKEVLKALRDHGFVAGEEFE